MSTPWLCRVRLHRWRRVFATGKYDYEECDCCHCRRVREVFPGGYQPIDRDWLEGGR